MSLVILKLTMLLTMDFLILKALAPPNKLGPSDKVETRSHGEKYMHFIRKFTVMPSFLLPNITLCLVLVLTSFGPRDISANICSRSAINELQRFSPTFLIIFTVIAGASIIRQICYKTLGEFFTYEITIRPQHKIIDIGPYAFVRHPSYLGSFMLLFGTAAMVFTSQNPVITCGWAATYTSARVFLGAWFMYGLYFAYWVLNRVHWEERVLRSHFGQAWDDYKKRVPCKFVPGIL